MAVIELQMQKISFAVLFETKKLKNDLDQAAQIHLETEMEKTKENNIL